MTALLLAFIIVAGPGNSAYNVPRSAVCAPARRLAHVVATTFSTSRMHTLFSRLADKTTGPA